MQTILTMRYPTSWHSDMWREGAPFGSGLVGGLVYGGLLKEIITLNHAFLWTGGNTQPLPDVSGHLSEIRSLLDAHNSPDADLVIRKALESAGYQGKITAPCSVCDLTIKNLKVGNFAHYRREIDMEKAEVSVRWQDGTASFRRCVFASRESHLVFTRLTAKDGEIDVQLSLCLHDPETMPQGREIPHILQTAKEDFLYFAAENVSAYRPGDFGGVCRIFTDGKMLTLPDGIQVTGATEILAVTRLFVGEPRQQAFAKAEKELAQHFDYDAQLAAHTAIHGALFHRVDFSISQGHTSNEELLLEAFEESASNELMEKLYAYGRYLFLCSTSDEGTLPCHLIGLFNGTWKCFWAFYMYNVNFEMIYWQALSGNLPSFLRLALDYTEAMVPDFQENARKIFGCRGILINSVNTPESGLYKCMGPHILNWTGGAAWISQHFWDYYRFTGDKDYLRNHALPFLYEAALFYEDFAVENADGYYDLYPSVSPENTPGNIAAVSPRRKDIETTKNATMELALMKELLHNLLEGCRITGMYPEKQEKWRQMLTKIRPYMVNTDGAVKEWTDPFYQDNYHHRHHSHLYPVFPGHEITKDDPLYPAFEKAEDLRLAYGISDQSSWSMVYMAGIAARMGRGDFALSLLDTITRTCLMNNLFTVHNDWRRMGPVACGDGRVAPFQIDGNIGIPGIINEMLLQSRDDTLLLLPALPSRWGSGHITGLMAPGNLLCDIYWDSRGGYAEIHSASPQTRQVEIGQGFELENHSQSISLSIHGSVKIPFFRR